MTTLSRYDNFAWRLQQAMTEQGLSVADLHRRLNTGDKGVTSEAVGHWARGRNEPGGYWLVRLAEELKVEPAWFYGRLPSSRASECLGLLASLCPPHTMERYRQLGRERGLLR